jgi:hypothetical protein
MTVIAYRDGVLAADSCATDASFQTYTQKLFRRKGVLIGFCGDIEQALVFVDWYFDRKSRQPDRTSENEWEAIVITKEGAEMWGPSLRPVPVIDHFYALGSGAAVAMGAMEAGATAKKAAQIACRRDPFCKEPVYTVRI